MRVFRIALPLTLLFLAVHILAPTASAQALPWERVILTGSDSPEALAGFVQNLLQVTDSPSINILLFSAAGEPPAQAAAEELRLRLETTCTQLAAGKACAVSLAPVFAPSGSESLDLQPYSAGDLAAIYFQHGDPQVAVQAISGTPLEDAISAAAQRGVTLAGDVPLPGFYGLRSLSKCTQAAPGRQLDFASLGQPGIDLDRDMAYGMTGSSFLLDQVLLSQDPGCLLNVLALPGAPHVAVAVSPGGGFTLEQGSRISAAFGGLALVLDGETYHAANAVRYQGPDATASLRNVLLHLLPPGQATFDLSARSTALATPQPEIERTFAAIQAPSGAGSLILAGLLAGEDPESPVLARFANLSGGAKAQIAILLAGYPAEAEARQVGERLAAALQVPSQAVVLGVDLDSLPVVPDTVSGILLAAPLGAALPPEALAGVAPAWQRGLPVLALGGAAESTASPGLSLLDLFVSAGLEEPGGFTAFASTAAAASSRLALGLYGGSAVEIDSQGAVVLGRDPVMLLDLRQAAFDPAAGQSPVFANGLLDVFAPGEPLRAERADMQAAPIHAATPVVELPTATATVTITPTPSPQPSATPEPASESAKPHGKPTRTPRPTSTPPVIPPPSDQNSGNMMIGFGVLAAIVLIVGVWLNWRHTASAD